MQRNRNSHPGLPGTRRGRNSILAMCLCLLLGSAEAGRYAFTDHPDNLEAPTLAVCQDFLKNLRLLGSPPMVCDRKFHSSLPQFSWPEWRSIDPLQHRDLVEQIWQERFGWAYDESSLQVKANVHGAESARRNHAELKSDFANEVARGNILLEVTDLKIGDESKTVLQIREGDARVACKPENWSSSQPPLRRYFIVDGELKKIDFPASENSVLGGYSTYMNERRSDLFLYQGKPYLAAWIEGGVGRGRIDLFGDYENFCFIDYTSSSGSKK